MNVMKKGIIILIWVMINALPMMAYRDRPADLTGRGLGAGEFFGQLLLIVIIVIAFAVFSKDKNR